MDWLPRLAGRAFRAAARPRNDISSPRRGGKYQWRDIHGVGAKAGRDPWRAKNHAGRNGGPHCGISTEMTLIS
jgi:hypothetical protein